ncbi:hypothetical protein [Microlunatus endophyticus]|uniref:hypothetical protein n=1 Tax=Microlunatus endophyticus TaxID=1716077 RepID=UPI001668009B|nr:hypothetical protein [Microlunatus endophyticus]
MGTPGGSGAVGRDEDPGGSLGFTAGVVISFAWLTGLAIEFYRRTRRQAGQPGSE